MILSVILVYKLIILLSSLSGIRFLSDRSNNFGAIGV